ncbi:hypothetical protein [Marinisporobacter balticus]|uniref:hypothetical protein n=1 Tax=Marinisporobacter balticus TaxID=2018667 RepID=UPI00104DAC5A|nr:hypothetical protein [Marinisporobacter balticus]
MSILNEKPLKESVHPIPPKDASVTFYIPEIIAAVISVVFIGIGLFIMDWRMALVLYNRLWSIQSKASEWALK